MLSRIPPVILIMGGIFFFSHQPADQVGMPDVPYLDKLFHFLAYTLLGLSVSHSVPPSWWHTRTNMVRLGVVLFCLLYGITDEVHQAFVPGRCPSPADVAADTVGAMVAVLLYSFYLKKKKKTGNRD